MSESPVVVAVVDVGHIQYIQSDTVLWKGEPRNGERMGPLVVFAQKQGRDCLQEQDARRKNDNT